MYHAVALNVAVQAPPHQPLVRQGIIHVPRRAESVAHHSRCSELPGTDVAVDKHLAGKHTIFNLKLISADYGNVAVGVDFEREHQQGETVGGVRRAHIGVSGGIGSDVDIIGITIGQTVIPCAYLCYRSLGCAGGVMVHAVDAREIRRAPLGNVNTFAAEKQIVA